MYKVTVEQLEACVTKALTPFSLKQSHIDYVVNALIFASIRGIDTHGISLLEVYIEELKGGRANPHPCLSWSQFMPAVATLDGGGALGVVAGFVGIKKAIAMAKTYGISAVSVKNSNHYGAAGVYAEAAAKQGMIGFSFSNSDALVAAHNGSQKVTGTNPLSMAVKGMDDDLFYLDMATSQVSFSKVMNMIETEECADIPELWIEKNELSDQCSKKDIVLKPLGGYKGQGLGMMVQILSATLSGMPMDHELSHLYSEPYDKKRDVGHFFICLNIEAFSNTLEFKKRITKLLKYYRASQSSAKENILVPGDIERTVLHERLRDGIPLKTSDYNFIKQYLIAEENTSIS